MDDEAINQTASELEQKRKKPIAPHDEELKHATSDQVGIKQSELRLDAKDTSVGKDASTPNQTTPNTIEPDDVLKIKLADMERVASMRARESQAVKDTLGLNGIPAGHDNQFGNNQQTDTQFRHIDIDKPVVKVISPDDAPARLKKRYLVTEKTDLLSLNTQTLYHHKDGANEVAFKDIGKQLSTGSNDTDIARSMVELAKYKNWSVIKLAGTDEFKREAWLHAKLNQLEVTGYSPSAVDQAKLTELQKLSAKKSDLADPAQNQQAQNQNHKQPSPNIPQQQATAGQTVPDNIPRTTSPETKLKTGTLVAFGEAPYQNDEKAAPSFYVTTCDASGKEKTTWGVDLERAITESGVQVGDTVSLEHKGQKVVKIHEAVRDADGQVTGYKDIEARRNTWEIKKFEANLKIIDQELTRRGYSRETIEKTKMQAQSSMQSMMQQGKPIPPLQKYDRSAPTLYRAPQQPPNAPNQQRGMRR